MQEFLKVAAYARISTDKDDQLNSLVNQRNYFADYITGHEHWQLCEVYYDEGISGTQTRTRPGFKKMIQDALNGEIDLIITKEVSRFARNTVDTLSYTRQLKDAGVGVVFTIDNIDTRDSDGELRLTIMASIAQEESRKTSERVKWGQKRQMERGVVFGRDLLGYTVHKGKLTINDEEAPIIREIFHKYTNEGKGTHIIARELTQQGMRPQKVSLWNNVTILRILRNEKYVGDLLQKKTFTPNYLTHKKKYNHGEEAVVYLQNHHEAIIERDLWNRTQEELKRRSLSEKMKSKHSNRYWCSGKLHCAECGNRYVSRTKKLKSGEIYKAWRCYAAANHGTLKEDLDGNPIGCDNSSINERSLYTCMNYCISLLQQDGDSLKNEILQEIKQLQKDPLPQVDSSKVTKKINMIENKKRKAIDLMLDGLITKEELKSQTNWYNEELEALNNQLSNVKDFQKQLRSQTDQMQQYIEALDDIMNLNSDNEMVYKEILDHIDVRKNNIIDIWLKEIPFGIQLHFKATGKGKFFKTDILETTLLRN